MAGGRITNDDSRRFRRGAALLSLGIGASGLLTYAYFALASHELSPDSYGNLVVLRHDFGLSTRYGHLSKFNVVPGATIKRGDILGYVGSTGRSTGAHLHYEILVNGKLINPLQLLTQPPSGAR